MRPAHGCESPAATRLDCSIHRPTPPMAIGSLASRCQCTRSTHRSFPRQTVTAGPYAITSDSLDGPCDVGRSRPDRSSHSRRLADLDSVVCQRCSAPAPGPWDAVGCRHLLLRASGHLGKDGCIIGREIERCVQGARAVALQLAAASIAHPLSMPARISRVRLRDRRLTSY